MTKKMKTDIETIYSLKYADYLEKCRKRDSARFSSDKDTFENLADSCEEWAWKLAGMRMMIEALGYEVKAEACHSFKLEKIQKEED